MVWWRNVEFNSTILWFWPSDLPKSLISGAGPHDSLSTSCQYNVHHETSPRRSNAQPRMDRVTSITVVGLIRSMYYRIYSFRASRYAP